MNCGKISAIMMLFGAVLVSAGCPGRKNKNESTLLMVSIQPLKYLVDSIVGGGLDVVVLVPPGVGPETYEPVPAQVKAAETAYLLFFTGLIDFEKALLERLPDRERFVNLNREIELIEGSCSHDHEHGHSHGVDPHIWMSPQALLRMAETAYERIHASFPDSVSYTANYVRLKERLALLDRQTAEKVEASPRRSFVILHPGLTYYARDYGLNQIALEQDGKEPSARWLRSVVEAAKGDDISKVLYQSEFPQSVVMVAAREIGAEPVEVDILGYDVVENISNVTDLITSE